MEPEQDIYLYSEDVQWYWLHTKIVGMVNKNYVRHITCVINMYEYMHSYTRSLILLCGMCEHVNSYTRALILLCGMCEHVNSYTRSLILLCGMCEHVNLSDIVQDFHVGIICTIVTL